MSLSSVGTARLGMVALCITLLAGGVAGCGGSDGDGKPSSSAAQTTGTNTVGTPGNPTGDRTKADPLVLLKQAQAALVQVKSLRFDASGSDEDGKLTMRGASPGTGAPRSR